MKVDTANWSTREMPKSITLGDKVIISKYDRTITTTIKGVQTGEVIIKNESWNTNGRVSYTLNSYENTSEGSPKQKIVTTYTSAASGSEYSTGYKEFGDQITARAFKIEKNQLIKIEDGDKTWDAATDAPEDGLDQWVQDTREWIAMLMPAMA